MEKKIFCREVSALPRVTISHPPPPHPRGPTRNSRENRVHVSTRARLRTYLVSTVRITAHSYALHSTLSLFPSFLPSSPVHMYTYISFSLRLLTFFVNFSTNLLRNMWNNNYIHVEKFPASLSLSLLFLFVVGTNSVDLKIYREKRSFVGRHARCFLLPS